MITCASYTAFVLSLAKKLPTMNDNMDHAILGMVTEMGELADAWKKRAIYEKPLDWTNIREECGDFMWYYALAVFAAGTSLDSIFGVASIGLVSPLERCDFNMTSIRVMLNGVQAVDYACQDDGITSGETIRRLVTLLEDFAHNVIAATGTNFADILQSNKTKLERRYPQGAFSTADALARKDKEDESS